MDNPGITLLGLGPGSLNQITRQAWEILQHAPEIHLRTKQHPVIAHLPAAIQVYSFDSLYDSEGTFEGIYQRIVEKVLELGKRPQGVVYGVPGHPFVAEATGPEIARRAKAMGIPYHIVEGLSFLEPVISALDQDPFPHTALVDALELAVSHVPPFPPSAPAIIAQIYSKQVANDVKLTLMSVYPDEHPVRFVHAAGTPQEAVEMLKLYEIDRCAHIGNLSALYVPELGPGTSFEAFQEIIAHLRAPDGCPWDRKQTHQSLRSHLLEETYETITALDADDPNAMREEFGDLLLQIVLHVQIASEYGEFSMAEVIRGIHEKIVRRHPHVFGDLELKDVDGVLHNWEVLKAAERAENGKAEAGLLDGVALILPALIQASEYQDRAARVGFDWSKITGVYDKIIEEMDEIQDAATDRDRAAEMGDLLFSVVNLARWLKVEPESALREANQRFRRRFERMERTARQQNRVLSDFSANELEDLWESAKRN